MKVVGIGYRDWSIEIYNRLKKKKIDIKIIKKKKINYKIIDSINPEYILFYGWSWKVPSKITKKYKCIMLHPSKLPNFAGGSPIQNQIIRNVKKSAVTLFRMNHKIDEGNIIYQLNMSLSGTLNDIFNRIITKGTLLTLKMFKKYNEKKSNVKKFYKRLKPINSEITLDELRTKKGSYLFNKIRMLQDPYPNPYIRTQDNKKLIIKKVILKK